MTKERKGRGVPAIPRSDAPRFVKIDDVDVPPSVGESEATRRFREVGFVPSGKGFGMCAPEEKDGEEKKRKKVTIVQIPEEEVGDEPVRPFTLMAQEVLSIS